MKKLRKIFTIFTIFFIFYFLFFILECLALEQTYPTIRGISLTEIARKGDLPGLINYVFHFALTVGGIIALTMITIAGFRWMSSAAAPGEKKEAMDQIKAGLFGLLLLLASWIILSTIDPSLVNLKMPGL